MSRPVVYGMYGLLVLIWSSAWVAVSLFRVKESAIRLIGFGSATPGLGQ